MPKRLPAPEVPGLVATRVFAGTWTAGPARSWDYHHPSDCRPFSKRIAVFMKDDKIGSTVRVIEGDGRRPSFVEHSRKVLPDGSSDDIAASVASEMAALLAPSASETPSAPEERLAAGILTANGFKQDDFYFQSAWLRESDIEGFTFYIRGAPEPQFVNVRGTEIPVPLVGSIVAEMPVEVGIASDYDKGRNSCIAPCLEEGIRVILEAMLPHPADDEVMVFDYDKLIAPKPGAAPARRT
jgi:hypothetical protein